MVVYTGLLRLMDSEDELANVLAHEAAHVVARHSVSVPSSCGETMYVAVSESTGILTDCNVVVVSAAQRMQRCITVYAGFTGAGRPCVCFL